MRKLLIWARAFAEALTGQRTFEEALKKPDLLKGLTPRKRRWWKGEHYTSADHHDCYCRTCRPPRETW